YGSRAQSWSGLLLMAGQQEAAAEGAAAGAGDGHFGVSGDLAVAAFTPQLHARLVQEPVAVQAAGGKLASVGVERDLAVAGDALTAFDERSPFALLAEPESFQPRQGDEAEAVVELGHVDVG